MSSAEAIQKSLKTALAGVHTSIPGRVISYDSVTQKATVQPVVRGRRINRATKALESYLPSPIPGVPVCFEAGDGWAFTGPMVEGTPVTIIFAHRSIDEWLLTGEADNLPVDLRRHASQDAIAIPGGRSFADPLPALAVDATRPVLYSVAEQLLGDSSATDFVALASLVLAELQALRNWAALHIHAGVLAGPANTGLVVGAPPVPGSVAATKVKAK